MKDSNSHFYCGTELPCRARDQTLTFESLPQDISHIPCRRTEDSLKRDCANFVTQGEQRLSRAKHFNNVISLDWEMGVWAGTSWWAGTWTCPLIKKLENQTLGLRRQEDQLQAALKSHLSQVLPTLQNLLPQSTKREKWGKPAPVDSGQRSNVGSLTANTT